MLLIVVIGSVYDVVSVLSVRLLIMVLVMLFVFVVLVSVRKIFE